MEPEFFRAFGHGVRAIVTMVHATGPSCLLPKISVGPITNHIRDLDEDEVRQDLLERSHRHLEAMSESIEYAYTAACDREKRECE